MATGFTGTASNSSLESSACPDRRKRQMTRTFYSIGHSSQSIDAFIELLYLHRIEVVADVRSHPVSRFAPQFNSESLREHLCFDSRTAGRGGND